MSGRRRAASPLPPFGTDFDAEQTARGRSLDQPSRSRDPSMREIFSSPVDGEGIPGLSSSAASARSRSRAPPGGATSLSLFGSAEESPSSLRLRSRSRGGTASSLAAGTSSGMSMADGWNASDGMAGVLGSNAAGVARSVADSSYDAYSAASRSRSRSRGFANGGAADSVFTTPSSAEPVPPLPSTMAASRIQQRSRSPSPPTSRAPYTSSPSRMGGSASRSLSGGTEHYYGAAASIGAPTDFTASLFKDDPAAFKKVEAKLLEYKQKLATATTRAEMLAKENASTKATVIRLEKETHKLSIDAHASAARAQALAAELASEKRDRADERASHAAELSALRTQMRGGNTQRGAAERDVESLRADVARLSADRDDARRDVAALSVNIAGLQATVAAVERRLTVAMQERDRAVLERNDGEAARIELEGQVRRLVGTSRAVEATRDEVMEELRYLQSMVHEERSKRLEAEVVVEEERKRRVLAELLEE